MKLIYIPVNGEKIRELRNKRKLTKTRLGMWLGCSACQIWRIESGRTKKILSQTLKDLCCIFDVSENELVV